MGLDDGQYQISSQLDRAEVCARTYSIRRDLEEYFSIACDRILPQDLARFQTMGVEMQFNEEELLPGDFLHFTSLRALGIYGRKLKSIPAPALVGLTQISKLDIRAPLEKISANNFAEVPTLKSLRFEHPADQNTGLYMDIEDRAFSGLILDSFQMDLPKLKFREQSFSGLETVDFRITGGFDELKHSHFSGLRAKFFSILDESGTLKVATGAFQNLTDLRELALHSKSLHLADDALIGLVHLKKIYFTGEVGLSGDRPFRGLSSVQQVVMDPTFDQRRLRRSVVQDLVALESLTIGWWYDSPSYLKTIEKGSLAGLPIRTLEIAVDLASVDPEVIAEAKEVENLQLFGLPTGLSRLADDYFARFPKLRRLKAFAQPTPGMIAALERDGFECAKSDYLSCERK